MPTVQTNGVNTYYEEFGDGPPVIFLHGATGDHRIWAEQLQPLAEDFTVLVYDLRGHGRTSGSEHQVYSMELYAEDLAAFIDALELDEPAVCGLSMGGMIGYQFAATYPEKLCSLVTLGAPTPRTFSVRERLMRVEIAKLLTPVMGNERIMRGFTWIAERASSDSSAVDMDDVGRIWDGHHCETPEIQSRERGKIMKGMQEYIGSSIDWENIRVPVLKMYGENEMFVETHTEYVQDRLDGLEIKEIPDASHNAHVDNPDFIIREIGNFLVNTNQSLQSEAIG
ncbi:MAG: 3-oxoadipate enol-lactonase [Halobacteriales archaeon]|jgi:3-oxoadipate enol-lactonase